MSQLNFSYRIKSYFNASHAIRWENGTGQKHMHTWEVVCELSSQSKQTVIFSDIEKALNGVFENISGTFLNTLDDFKELNPTVENVTLWLYHLIIPALNQLDVHLTRLEVSESPTRTYCITSSN
ncbi:6-carboxytetrahydropterin synthase [Liquorilactobacillus uvarum]|nr:6-carboxytetrahydropterin synthase [Liquorilactobacillus uvarum]